MKMQPQEDYFCAAFGYPSGQVSMPYHGISLAGPTEGPEAYTRLPS